MIMESSVYLYIASIILLWHQVLIIESSVNLAVDKTTSQSSTYGFGWESSKAVNGHQDCSSGYTHTNTMAQSAWWQVDLGNVYEIKTIKIFFRDDFQLDYNYYLQRLNGYSINIIDSQQQKWQCFKDEDVSQLPATLKPIHICPHLGQYVEFAIYRLPNNTYIKYDNEGAVVNLCELEVYGCPRGHYGDTNCLSTCSKGCRESTCDPDYGNCSCIDGWTGNMCHIRTCQKGYYGIGCKPCSTGCLNNNCDVTNGECTDGCLSFSYGQSCNLSCPKNCNNSTCNMDSGDCIYCKSGYYGKKCNVTCPRNCKDGTCYQTSGHCWQCVDFFQGNTCTDCINGHYGKTCIACSEGCLNKNCSKENGYCTYGCNVGFYEDFCNMSCPTNCKNNTCNRKTGDCTHGCKTTFLRGAKCDECVDGKHGVKCDKECPLNCNFHKCNRLDGFCSAGCKYKNMTGDTCKDCFDGKYGANCDKECPSNCNFTKCTRVDGLCSAGCKYKHIIGNRCEECSDRFYGTLCNLPCNENCNKCNRNTGECTSCVQGTVPLSPMKCSKSVSTAKSESQTQTNNIGPIIGGIVTVIAVVVIAVVIVLFLKRRRRNSGKENGYENQITFSLPKLDNELKDKQKKSHYTDNVKESVVSIENGNEYCNSPEVYMNLSLTEVPISELSSIISTKTAEKEFESEYEKLPKGSKHPTTVGKNPDNKIKNRFLTTFPYDHSRVVLKPISTQQKSDYINANYIDGAETRRAYIATQGPKTNTLFDFWKMVWQEKSGKIVMLTNLIENEKPKCEQYWPDIGKEKDFGPLKITMESEKEYAFFVERSLQLTNKKTKETRQILQFHFTMWPDHGTPDPVQLMLFHRKVKEEKTTLTGPPIIHCAAGIGRTGTFIALDTLHDYGDKTGRIDIFEYVIRMRKERMNMIQTLEQYVVLHEALLESFQYTGRSLSRNKFSEVCSELNKARPKNQTHVYKEFQNLSALRPVYGIESYDSALEKDNRRKSRNQNILAVEKYRPFLMSQHSSRNNFINAVMLPTFRKKCGYFVTHYPLENTVVDFWCLVFDHDSSTVVVLDEISDKDNVLHWYPDNKTEMAVDSFQIKKVSGPHINGRVREIEFSVTHHDDEKSVRMLMIRPWPTERCVPPDKHDLVKLIEMTLERQATDSGPVTIVCSDGARCCGLFCTVCNVILNLRIEDEIDIFHTVRQLQIRRPQFITDYEEYKSCYEIVKLFLESSSASVYANA